MTLDDKINLTLVGVYVILAGLIYWKTGFSGKFMYWTGAAWLTIGVLRMKG